MGQLRGPERRPVDIAQVASRLPGPVQQPAGTLMQLLADLFGADTVATPA